MSELLFGVIFRLDMLGYGTSEKRDQSSSSRGMDRLQN